LRLQSSNSESRIPCAREGRKHPGMHIIPLLILLLSFAESFPAVEDSMVIGSVNGYPIRAGEMRLATLRQRARVLDSLSRYGNPGLQKPQSVLEKQAFDECVSIKVQQILALEQGIVEDIDFTSLQRQRVKENKERKRITAEGGVVYGPVEYDEDSYFRYILNNMKIHVMDKIESEMSIPESELKDRYERETKMFTEGPAIDVVFLWAHDATMGIGEAATSALRLALTNGGNCATAKIAAADGRPLRTTCDTLHLDEGLHAARYKVGRLLSAQLLKEARPLDVGSVSPVFGFDEGIGAIKCIRKGTPSRKSFEEVRESIRATIISERYQAILAVRRANAEVRKWSGHQHSAQMFR